MLRWLGDRHDDPAATQAADRIEAAVRGVIAEAGVGTPDLGGKMSTGELGDEIVQAL